MEGEGKMKRPSLLLTSRTWDANPHVKGHCLERFKMHETGDLKTPLGIFWQGFTRYFMFLTGRSLQCRAGTPTYWSGIMGQLARPSPFAWDGCISRPALLKARDLPMTNELIGFDFVPPGRLANCFVYLPLLYPSQHHLSLSDFAGLH